MTYTLHIDSGLDNEMVKFLELNAKKIKDYADKKFKTLDIKNDCLVVELQKDAPNIDYLGMNLCIHIYRDSADFANIYIFEGIGA